MWIKFIGQSLFQPLVILKIDRLLVIGLAPAANGGNRTGRIFTGDSSGDWFVKALFETGFANKSISK
jgi:uracil-DNA glycosylase